jgi:hypothetical protein
MRDQELILRYFALLKKGASYSKPMKEFLNSFMSKNREVDKAAREQWSKSFTGTVRAIRDGIGKDALKPTRAVNAALADAVMVGISRRLSDGPIKDNSTLKAAYQKLLDMTEFDAAISSATTDEAAVKTRISLATKAFEKVK